MRYKRLVYTVNEIKTVMRRSYVLGLPIDLFLRILYAIPIYLFIFIFITNYNQLLAIVLVVMALFLNFSYNFYLFRKYGERKNEFKAYKKQPKKIIVNEYYFFDKFF